METMRSQEDGEKTRGEALPLNAPYMRQNGEDSVFLVAPFVGTPVCSLREIFIETVYYQSRTRPCQECCQNIERGATDFWSVQMVPCMAPIVRDKEGRNMSLTQELSEDGSYDERVGQLY